MYRFSISSNSQQSCNVRCILPAVQRSDECPVKAINYKLQEKEKLSNYASVPVGRRYPS